MSQKTKNIITEVLTGLGLIQSLTNAIPSIPQWVGVTVAGVANILNEILKQNDATVTKP